MIACILGILRSGAAYIPIDPEYPRERVEHILNAGGLALLIAGRETLSAWTPPVPFLDIAGMGTYPFDEACEADKTGGHLPVVDMNSCAMSSILPVRRDGPRAV